MSSGPPQEGSQDQVEEIISYETIEPLLQPPPMYLEKEVQDSVMEFRKRLLCIRLTKINKNFQTLSNIWPEGRPVDYFIGLELCNDDINMLFDQLKTTSFTRTIISEASQRGFPLREQKVTKSISKSYSDLDSDGDQDEEMYSSRKKKKNGKKKSSVNWEPEEISEFVYQYNNFIQEQTWSAFCSRFYGKTEEDCEQLLKKLRKQGKITIEAPKAEPKSKKLNFVAITFVKGDRRVRVGPTSIENEERMAMNPIPGYIDMITQTPMEIPAVSPDDYVLDYSTWLKLLNEKKVNPFTQNHLTSKRQLVILTIDNFDEYKDRIVNLEEAKPPK
ncbi:hypothetical protein TVAG_092860 [Trichomonas vaginalis G3]|uniref:U-box domain-containing protein n=1 Tax=Trichomonas vaginalis (strain ATCC PRA-98 / G3) TaxID=412133 RepID=A2GBV2_TRIV3|nr:RING/U-box family [Trichomonas vaginalis G3]EAX85366.1 hypothetical protein TVAG_092860 [Trichomonas vaginalis G3]KAI5534965.1 RING/U-box family [Trichomonas vaginalis G3]|eukprot:XP_001298296.1 hypothetical protein [Trichomonas vaginalis G3]